MKMMPRQCRHASDLPAGQIAYFEEGVKLFELKQAGLVLIIGLEYERVGGLGVGRVTTFHFEFAQKIGTWLRGCHLC